MEIMENVEVNEIPVDFTKEELSDEQLEELTAPEVEVEEPVAEKQDEPRPATIEEIIAALQAKIAALESAPKNHRAGKPGNSTYTRLGSLKTFGKVPQQQLDLAKILTDKMKVGESYTEEQVFNFVTEGAVNYPSLKNSKQDPTYLFRYYRGLKHDAPHAGFIARDFLRQVK